MSGLIDAEEFRKQFFELETEFRPSQIDAVFDCLHNCEILDVDKKERNMSEVRLIDANALVADTSFYDGGVWHYGYSAKKIENAPTVDAVPVRHGHWEVVPNDHNTDSYYKMRCSVCGGTLWSIQSEELYCCKCGSKMDGADGERR